jgi:hypothetical protein
MANNSFHYKFIFITNSFEYFNNKKTYGDGVISWSGKKDDPVKLIGYIRGSCSQNFCKKLPYSIIKRGGSAVYSKYNYISESSLETWLEDIIPDGVEIMWIYSNSDELLWTIKRREP